MSGLASLNRYHAYPWQEGAPYPGELEYLGNARREPQPRRKSWTYERPVYEHDRFQRMDGFGHPD